MYKKIVLEFIKAINNHDVDAICGLMSEGHKFIDAHGNEVTGKENMRAAWEGYFSLFPDYKIEITDIFEKSETFKTLSKKGMLVFNSDYKRYDFIVAFGFASGTYMEKHDDNNNHFRLPAAWKSLIEGGKISHWQVFCDTKIPFDIIEKNK